MASTTGIGEQVLEATLQEADVEVVPVEDLIVLRVKDTAIVFNIALSVAAAAQLASELLSLQVLS